MPVQRIPKREDANLARKAAEGPPPVTEHEDVKLAQTLHTDHASYKEQFKDADPSVRERAFQELGEAARSHQAKLQHELKFIDQKFGSTIYLLRYKVKDEKERKRLNGEWRQYYDEVAAKFHEYISKMEDIGNDMKVKKFEAWKELEPTRLEFAPPGSTIGRYTPEEAMEMQAKQGAGQN